MSNQAAESEWADRFNRDVNTLQHNGRITSQKLDGLPQDYQEALAVAQVLQSTQVAQLSRIRTSLRQKLTRSEAQRGKWSISLDRGVQTMNTSSTKIPLVRQMAIVLALLVLILSLSLTIQPVRALASQILGQMGIFTFTNETAIPDEWIGQENFKNNGEATPMPVENLQGLSAEEAEQQSGFVLYTPTYVPACFTLNSRQVLFGQGATIVSTAYHCLGESSYDAVFLYMSQTPMQDENKTNFAIGDAQPVEIRLRGQTGVWINQAPIGVQSNREGKTELMPVNILAWEEGGFFFQLQSNQLSQDEMLRVAESLE